jgi:hypothetical protein
MWIVKSPHPLSAADLRENLTRLEKSRECDDSFPPMATVYIQVLVAIGRETMRLLGGNLSLHTDEMKRAADLPQVIFEALSNTNDFQAITRERSADRSRNGSKQGSVSKLRRQPGRKADNQRP